MKRYLPLALLAALLTPDLPAQQEGLLKENEREDLGELVAEFFKAKLADDYKQLAKTSQDLEKEMEKKAKSKKVDSLLQSPVDMRVCFSYPLEPVKNPKRGRFYDYTFTEQRFAGPVEIGYLLYLPKDYKTGSFVPLIVALHPSASKMDEVRAWADSTFPESVGNSSAVLVPLNLNGIDWLSDDGLQLFFAATRVVFSKEQYIDRSKIFLHGSQATAPQAVAYATGYPGTFSGLILQDASQAPVTEALENLRNMEVLVISSGDEVSKAFADEAKARNVSVTEQSAADAAEAAPLLVEFVGRVRKNFTPTDIVFKTRSAYHQNAYWLQVTKAEFSPDVLMTVEGRVDKSTNEIMITTPDAVRELRIYLNDDLVDMGKPIKVVHLLQSGDDEAKKVRFDGEKARSLERALTMAFLSNSGNLGEVYSNYIDIRIR